MTIPISSWPEWLACAIVVTAVLVGSKFRRSSIAAIMMAVPIAWVFGTAGGLLIPLSLGAAIWLVISIVREAWEKHAAGFAVLCSLATGILCGLFPVPVPPLLNGKYGIGTVIIEIPETGNLTRLLAQVWYPSPQLVTPAPVPWLPDPLLAPDFPYHRLLAARAHSRAAAPLAAGAGQWPVIFYEHSWAGHRAENIIQVESLASRGFVVVAVDHPGQAKRAQYADGSVIVGRYNEGPELTTSHGIAEFEIMAARCLSERRDNLERVRLAFKGGAAGRLTGQLDLDHVGVFGFSFGGTSAIHLCANNPAFVAGANEDGLYLFNEMPKGPFLFFDEEYPAWMKVPANEREDAGQLLTRTAEARILKALKQPGRDRVIIEGTRHLSFSDRIYSSPIPRLARVGWRPANEVHEILDSRLVTFFKEALRPRTGSE